MIKRFPLGQPVKITGRFFNDEAQDDPVEAGGVTLHVFPPGGDEETFSGGNLEHTATENSWSRVYVSPSWGDVKYEWRSTDPVIIIPGLYEVFET